MDLNRTSTFVSVVDAGGFSAAASRLGLPTSSVSRSVSRLEEELGVVLLERTTRRIALTDAGRAYYERARDALSGLAEASALAVETAREPRGLVRVAAPPPIGALIAPPIATFAEQYPHVRIAVRFTMQGAEALTAEPAAERADLAIAFGRLPDSGLVARRIGTAYQTLVASPSYVGRHGAPERAADLTKHATLDVGGAAERAWALELPEGGTTSIPVTPAISADDFELLRALALAGRGIAFLPEIVTHAARGRGELVEILPGHRRSHPMQIVTRPSRLLARRVSLFRDHLVASLDAHSCSP